MISHHQPARFPAVSASGFGFAFCPCPSRGNPNKGWALYLAALSSRCFEVRGALWGGLEILRVSSPDVSASVPPELLLPSVCLSFLLDKPLLVPVFILLCPKCPPRVCGLS